MMEPKAHILIIDDNEELAEGLYDFLEDNGFSVECSYNGKDAVALMHSNSFDIALVDVRLPDIAGDELSRKLRYISPSTEFILMTASVSLDSVIEAVKQEHVVSYEIKPINMDHLLSTINQISRRKRADNELKENYRKQEILNRLLKISLHESDLSNQLEESLDVILSIPWMPTLPKGGIFLVDYEDEILVMKVSRRLDKRQIEMCSSVPFGHCICGRVAKTGNIIYKECVDEQHENLYEGIVPHGHYIVPIKLNKRVIGVLLLYLNERQQRHEREELFLESIANTLAGMIKRKQVEEGLREQEESLRAIYTTADNIALITIDLGGESAKILDFSPGAEKMFGYCKEEVIKERVAILHPQKFINDISAMEEALRRGERGFSGETVQIRKGGEEFPVFYTIHPRYDANKRVIGALGVVIDLTSQKKIEKERLKIQKLESLGILAGGIAHDFNNYLACILGHIALAKLGMKREDAPHKNLVEVEKISFIAKKLTSQLITFSKGGLPIMKTSSIKEVIEDSISFSLRGSKVTCQISVPDNLWPVDIDAGQIGQVINNFIINADQAMPDGGIIRVFAENVTIDSKEVPTLKSGDYVKTTVVDHGCGIPKEQTHMIFDPYFTTKEKGSGLGLAVCFSIIKCHGGYIGVESEVGVGSTFHFYIPISEEQIEMRGVQTEAPLRGKGRILLMDDEVQIRYTISELLRNIGYDVEVCREGEEAIRLYSNAKGEARPFDAVILDLTIPGGQGGDVVVKRLLKIDPDVKAIVSSGYSNDPILSNAKSYGFRGCVSKPFEIEELNKVIHDVITCKDDSGGR